MAFDGTEGKIITLSEGAAITAAYRRDNPGKIIARFIGREHLQSILDQSDCMGIRVYFGKNSSNQPEIVLVGADSSEKDMLDIIADQCLPCPTRCSTPNALNS